MCRALRSIAPASLLPALLAVSSPLVAQSPRLGVIDFPTSAATGGQREFLTGVLYLHSFEYESAAAVAPQTPVPSSNVNSRARRAER